MKVPPMRGLDVDAHADAAHRYLQDGQLNAYRHQKPIVRETFGTGKRTLMKKAAKKAELPQYGVLGPALYQALWEAGCYKGRGTDLLLEYARPVMPSLVYVHDKRFASYSTGNVHVTGGISGNYALDFMAEPGTPVLALEDGVISRTSGNDPRTGLHGSFRDVFGWSIYLKVRFGFYYLTHMGRLFVHGGDTVKVGDVIGEVGDWPHDRGRSHTHAGYTNILHLSYLSTRQIRTVAAAPRVSGNRR